MSKQEEAARNQAADHLYSEFLVTLAREGTMTGAGAKSVANIARQAFIAGWNARSEQDVD
jgi:hypothetical protein